jgi:hypothetical protein
MCLGKRSGTPHAIDRGSNRSELEVRFEPLMVDVIGIRRENTQPERGDRPGASPVPSRGPNSNDSFKTISRSTVVKLGNSRTTQSPPGRPGASRIGLSSITVASVIHLSKRLLFDPKLFWTLASLVVVADVALTQLIVHFVPCAKSPTSAASDLSPTIH